jgi:hypothetical protein
LGSNGNTVINFSDRYIARIFEGYIDKVKVFEVALKQKEVDAIMPREIKHIGKKVEDPVSPANEAL